jgi:hypothetical protein
LFRLGQIHCVRVPHSPYRETGAFTKVFGGNNPCGEFEKESPNASLSGTLNRLVRLSSARSVERRTRSFFQWHNTPTRDSANRSPTNHSYKDPVANKGPKRPKQCMSNISRNGPEFPARFKALRLPICRQCGRYFGSPGKDSALTLTVIMGQFDRHWPILHNIHVALTTAVVK